MTGISLSFNYNVTMLKTGGKTFELLVLKHILWHLLNKKLI
jgi:hypothetical protein